MYGKATECSIAALSRLAEVYDGGKTKLSAVQIAHHRNLLKPFVGKVLTTLSQAGLVHGSRGPGGGFCLAKHPAEISIYDVFKLFEREEDSDLCPFGGGICGVGVNCALHEKLAKVQDAVNHVLHETTFEDFRAAVQDHGLKPTLPSEVEEHHKRETYRAPYKRKGFP
ncbi:MAG: transcriptional regulator [Planctomycetota bacterium]|nr:MAG: transcriptional regulator [Planctomycetota bacterium]